MRNGTLENEAADHNGGEVAEDWFGDGDFLQPVITLKTIVEVEDWVILFEFVPVDVFPSGSDGDRREFGGVGDGERLHFVWDIAPDEEELGRGVGHGMVPVFAVALREP